MFAEAKYDVYVTAEGPDADRRAAMPYLVVMHPLDEPRAAALLRGERILLSSGAKRGEADKIADDVRALGFRVDVEARSESFEAVGIDGTALHEASDDVPRVAAPGDNPFFDVSAGLVGLDGDDAEPVKPTPVKPEPVRPKAPPPVPARAPVAPVAAAPVSRFRPANMDDPDQQLVLDRAPIAAHEAYVENSPIAERCGTHDVELVRGRCGRCDAEDAYVKSRVMGGKLRDKPQLRYGIGIGAGLVLGWIVTAPMARHGDMRVQDLHEQAARERARPTDEGQAKAAQLDAEADDIAGGATAKTYGTWALIIAGVTAAWLKLS